MAKQDPQTPAGLPVVSKETLETMAKDGLEGSPLSESNLEVVDGEVQEMGKYNPHLFEFILTKPNRMPERAKDIINMLPSEQAYHLAYQEGARECYRALRVQAEVNKLEQDLETPK